MTEAEAVELARSTAAKRGLQLSTTHIGELLTNEWADILPTRVGKWYLIFTRPEDEGAVCGYFDQFKFWIDDQTAAIEWNEPPDPPPLWKRVFCRVRDAIIEIPLMILALPLFPFFWVARRIIDVAMDRAERKRIARTPGCPRCGERLRTPKAQQCFHCGLDWHGGPMPTQAEARSLPLNQS